jgi:hypothetical protein
MDPTEMKVQAVCFTFTRTLRSKHVAQPSVYARTKEKNSVSLLLENLMFFPNIWFFSLFLLSNTHQPFYVFCVTYCKGNTKSGTTEGTSLEIKIGAFLNKYFKVFAEYAKARPLNERLLLFSLTTVIKQHFHKEQTSNINSDTVG